MLIRVGSPKAFVVIRQGESYGLLGVLGLYDGPTQEPEILDVKSIQMHHYRKLNNNI
jgi:hypothetical protein